MPIIIIIIIIDIIIKLITVRICKIIDIDKIWHRKVWWSRDGGKFMIKNMVNWTIITNIDYLLYFIYYYIYIYILYAIKFLD